MDYLHLMKTLHIQNQSKIVLLVMDGLGGLPITPGGPTELEAANTPNLDALAAKGTCGLSVPVAPGVTPGSGPSHLALFGYDPLQYEFGRGVLEVMGVGFPLQPDDIAVRGNFCTVDGAGLITDRRAGRIASDKSAAICALLQQITIPDMETFVLPVKEHRFAVVFRGKGLNDRLADTDPQIVGKAPLPLQALTPEAEHTAALVTKWIEAATALLADQHPANSFVLRGFSKDPGLPKMLDVYGLKAAAIATYPMYRGVSKLVGMDVLETGENLEDEVQTLKNNWDKYDFFYFHVKKTDSRGEDGDFAAKVHVIESLDAVLPDILALQPDVIVVSGDHSTPAAMKGHSWHPVPTLLASQYCRPDDVQAFGERNCAHGGLGRFAAVEIMPMAMANALRLEKYGA